MGISTLYWIFVTVQLRLALLLLINVWMVILAKRQTGINGFLILLLSLKVLLFFSFDVDRSIIRLPDASNRSHENRPTTNTVLHMRTADILSSFEYRQLEKKKQDLEKKIENLKSALKKVHQEKKKMEITHKCKIFVRYNSFDS